MDSNKTLVVTIGDSSGSMTSIISDAIGGFNSLIEEQKKLPGECLIHSVLFDNHQNYKIVHDMVNVSDVPKMTIKEWSPDGLTALYDAIGKTINHVGTRLSEMDEPARPGKVIVIITTDGLENNSQEFTASQVKEMITHQRDVYNWEFIFTAANQDATLAAETIGVDRSRAATFTANARGTESLYNGIQCAVKSYRTLGFIEEDALENIQ